METLGDKIKQKNSQNSASKYFCESCDYGTCKKSNYETHVESAKHKKVTNGYIEGQNSAKIQPKNKQTQNIGEIFTCFCGKEYLHRQGLWRHKKNCIIQDTCVSQDENIWEKDEDQSKMRKAIKKVVTKNMRLIPKFREQYPDYKNSYSKTSDIYNKLIIESMGGSGDNDAEKEDKIIRNIVKNVVVDKSI